MMAAEITEEMVQDMIKRGIAAEKGEDCARHRERAASDRGSVSSIQC